jgi:hypothetical protein
MDGVQKRPLTGMISSNVAAPRPVAVAPGTTLHTLDNSSTANGGPYVDMVTLWVNNPTGGALDLTITIGGGTAILVAIASKTTVKVLDEEVFQNAPSASAVVINGIGSGAGLVFWGDFARIL